VKLKILFLYFFIFVSHAIAYHSYFRNYSVENGLPFIQINTIFQDSRGYLWIGGYGGLSKFDGNVFQNFSPKNGLVNYSVTSICEDDTHKMWVATINGLSCITKDKFTNYTPENATTKGLTNYNINCVVAHKKNIWIATKRGLFCFDSHTFTKIIDTDFKINTLKISDENEILLGTDLGLFSLDIQTKKINFISNCPEVSAICKRENNFLVATLGGLFLYKKTENILEEVKDSLVQNVKLNTVVCIDNTTFIASDNGIIKQVGNKYFRYKINETYNANLVSTLCADDEKNLWLGTYSGLYRYRSDDFIAYTKEDGIGSNFIFQVLRTKDKKLFVASGGNGIYVQNKNGFDNLSLKDGLIDDYVWSACADKQGNIWCGTNEGISVYDGKNFKSYTQRDGILNNFCITVYTENNGTIWIGNRGGVTKFENNKFTTYKINSSNDCDVSVIFKTRNNTLLFGAYQGGLFKLEGNKLIDYGKQIGIKSESIMAIEEDNKGNLYIGTFDGLYIYNKNQKLVNLSTDNGLSSDLIYQLKIDAKGKYLWIGTNQSLNRFNLEKYHNKGEQIIYQIGKNDGFSGVECNTGAVFVEGDSTIWFGTVNGLYKFNINEFYENIRPAKTEITGLKINYEEAVLLDNAKLDYDNNNITFYYTGICYTNPEKVLYTIKLEGYDKEWRPASNVSIANYPNLPPGKYIFKVKSCNNEGVWNNSPATYSFQIFPPWYKTWLFRILALLLIIAITYLFLRNRANNIRENERTKVEQEVAVASNELKALRSQMNPHFIFNSLNSIQHFVVSNDSEKASKYLNKFSKLIRLILSHSEKQLITLAEEIELLNLYLELEQVRFESKFTYQIIVDKNLDVDFVDIPTMLVQPFVENAILHGLAPKQGGGKLLISFTIQLNNILCVIEDDGIGRNASQNLKSRNTENNLSIATKNTSERIELLKKINDKQYSFYIFDVNENDKTGTRVEIILPYDV